MKQFMSIKDTATYSGLSQFYIRNRCKNGTIPHRMMGKKYMVDYEAFTVLREIFFFKFFVIPPAPHFLVMFSFGFVNNVRC